MKKFSFKKKVKSMKASEIVQAMIDGLEKEWVKVDMYSFGRVEDGVCYGCAATNAICEIMQYKVNPLELDIWRQHVRFATKSDYFLGIFESAINELRQGDIGSYNLYAAVVGLAKIPKEIRVRYNLPVLDSTLYKEHLLEYKQLARELRLKGV